MFVRSRSNIPSANYYDVTHTVQSVTVGKPVVVGFKGATGLRIGPNDPSCAIMLPMGPQLGINWFVLTGVRASNVMIEAKVAGAATTSQYFQLAVVATVATPPSRFGSSPKFHEGVHHDHTPSRKFDDVIRHPNNSGTDTLKAILDKICVGLVALADAPIPLPHGPELLVNLARPALLARAGLVASAHLEFYLSGSGKDFVEDTNIKGWVTADSGIRKKLKGAIFPRGAKPRSKGEFFFGQGEYATDRTSQDFRFAFGSIDFVSFEVDLASKLVRVFFKDRYEWHPFYPKLYPVKTGDVARDDNCLHAALVEMQDQGAADYWMVGVAEVPLSLIAKP